MPNDRNGLFFGTPMTATVEQLNASYTTDMTNFTVQEGQSQRIVHEKELGVTFSQLFDTYKTVRKCKAKRTYSIRDPMTPIVKMSTKETQFLSESSDEEMTSDFNSSVVSSNLSPNNSKSDVSLCVTPDPATTLSKPVIKKKKLRSRRKSIKRSTNHSAKDQKVETKKVDATKKKKDSFPKELNGLSSPYDFWGSGYHRVTRAARLSKSKETYSESPVNPNRRQSPRKLIDRTPDNKTFKMSEIPDDRITPESIQTKESNVLQMDLEEDIRTSPLRIDDNDEHILENNREDKSKTPKKPKNVSNIRYDHYRNHEVLVPTESPGNCATAQNNQDTKNVFVSCDDLSILTNDQDSHESIQVDADGDYLIENDESTTEAIASNENAANENVQPEKVDTSKRITIKTEPNKEASSCEIITYEVISDEESTQSDSLESGNISIESLTPKKCVVNNTKDLDIKFYISAYKLCDNTTRSQDGNDYQEHREEVIRQMKEEPTEDSLTNSEDGAIPYGLGENNLSSEMPTNYAEEFEGSTETPQNPFDGLEEIYEGNDQTKPQVYLECNDASNGPSPIFVNEEEQSIDIFNGPAEDGSSASTTHAPIYFQGFTESQIYSSFMKNYLCEAAKGKPPQSKILSYRGNKYIINMSITKLVGEENTTSLNGDSTDSLAKSNTSENAASIYPGIPDVFLVEESSRDRNDHEETRTPEPEITEAATSSPDQHGFDYNASNDQEISVVDGLSDSPARNFSQGIASNQAESHDIFSPGYSSPICARSPMNESHENSQISSEAEADPLFIETGSPPPGTPQNGFWNSYPLSPSPPTSPSIMIRSQPFSDDECSDEDMIEGTPQKANLTFSSLNASHRSSAAYPSMEIIDFSSMLDDELPMAVSYGSEITESSTFRSHQRPFVTDQDEKVVIAVSGLPLSERRTVQMFADMFGYEFTDSLHQKLTILVMSPRKQESMATFKYILAIASRAQIVSMSWINESLRAKMPLPPEEFALSNEGGALRCHLNIPPPLVDTTICIELVQDEYPGGLAVQAVCEMAGAKVIHNIEQMNSPTSEDDFPFPRFYLFRVESQLTSQILNKCSSHSAVAVSFHWLFESLFSYKILPIGDFLGSTFVSSDVLTNGYNVPLALTPRND